MDDAGWCGSLSINTWLVRVVSEEEADAIELQEQHDRE